jgi:hypothetical protein
VAVGEQPLAVAVGEQPLAVAVGEQPLAVAVGEQPISLGARSGLGSSPIKRCAFLHLHTHIHTYMHVYIHRGQHHVNVQLVHAYIHTYIHTGQHHVTFELGRAENLPKNDSFGLTDAYMCASILCDDFVVEDIDGRLLIDHNTKSTHVLKKTLGKVLRCVCVRVICVYVSA